MIRHSTSATRSSRGRRLGRGVRGARGNLGVDGRSHGTGQIRRGQHPVAAVEHRPAKDVLQLADVARPRVLPQGRQELRLDVLDVDVVSPPLLNGELSGQKLDVPRPLTQRRQVESSAC